MTVPLTHLASPPSLPQTRTVSIRVGTWKTLCLQNEVPSTEKVWEGSHWLLSDLGEVQVMGATGRDRLAWRAVVMQSWLGMCSLGHQEVDC
jgi:hypothetical protein